MKVKKTLICIFLVSLGIVFLIGNTVYSKYILDRSFDVTIKTMPFYFDATAEETSLKLLSEQSTANIVIKNYEGNSFNKTQTQYSIAIKNNEKFTITVQDPNNGKIEGNGTRENKVSILIKANNGVSLNTKEQIILTITATEPYAKTIEIPLTIVKPSLVEGGRNDYRKVKYSDDTEGKPEEVYDQLYGGNNGELEINPDGSIVLDKDNPVMVFDKSDKDYSEEYSVYITVKGDIDQVPTDSSGKVDTWGPATIFAMSGQQYTGVTGNVVNRLCWFGFRNGCLQVYSYLGSKTPNDINDEFYDPNEYLGFISKKLPRKYDNQIMNIQVTANTNNTTEVYLNGELFLSFDSGKGTGEFHEATIGDLRALRGIKFIGTFYDINIYDKKLSLEEVKQNWEYAQDKWNIPNY